MTDASGNTLTNEEQRYYPFGEKRTPIGTILTDRLYTGQRDTGLGIYYYNARFYSPYINHFVSADTIVPSYANPQNLNRYSYVANNPLRYIDPTGHARLENEFGGGCSTSGYCESTPYSPPPPPVNYCDAHPNACGGPGNNGGTNSTTTPFPVLTPTPSQTTTPTPAPGGANDYCFTHPYSCPTGTPLPTGTSPIEGTSPSISINWNAVVDPLAWEHIAGSILGGVGLAVFGTMVMIPMGAEMCTTFVGCVAGIPLVIAGGAAVLEGGVLIWSGVKFTEVYLDEIFVETP